MATGVVAIGSDLERKKWMVEGLIQKASQSFWAAFTGTTDSAIVFQANNISSKEGHTVVFDFRGNLTGKAIKGKNTAFGKGEQKRKFSDSITVDRYRLVVDNGDKFDGVNIGDLSINEHSDSRSSLADLFIRWKDQMLFDVAQGCITRATHVYKLGTTFNYNSLIALEGALKSGKGFVTSNGKSTTSAGQRRRLDPYRLENGEDIWLFIIDSKMATALKSSDGYQTLLRVADLRGPNNRLIKGVIGQLGRLVIVEASDFFGGNYDEAEEQLATVTLESTEVEIAGLRKYTASADSAEYWEGTSSYTEATAANWFSRGLVMGGSALKLAFGKMPDYKFQESEDFGIKTESAVEYWVAAEKVKLALESGIAYKQAKVDDLDYGVIAVDLAHG
jgi:hypothetical protein